MRRPNNSPSLFLARVALVALVAATLGGLAAAPSAASGQQQPAPPAKSPAPPAQRRSREYTLSTDVNLVVLHATVLDKKNRVVNNLEQRDFRVSENGVPQKLSVFSHADIPVTMGIVIDDSGSMREKRPAVNAAALTFVKTSNPQDQAFVVNFNDVYYLDTPGDFAANADDLKSALGKIDSRGGTALYDAIYASLDHLKLGNRDKKVLLVVTDGDDNASRYSFDELVRRAQQSDAVIYTIGLIGDEESSPVTPPPGSQDTGIATGPSGGSGGSSKSLFKFRRKDKHFANILKEIARATGGQAYFPKSLDEVQSTCQQIAHDIRNQYTLAYYPTNKLKDGTFRAVQVEAFVPGTRKRLVVRTRPGYYAPRAGAGEPSSVASGQ
ncbi:MAG TPA: VWA domain-containing protein [Terriglobia bacterium]|nr:VWA domain-containing protein [Terriglobia bacterium]